MRQLQQKFTGKGQVRGFEFTQIKKSQHAYIYEVDSGDSIYYEVFEHKENTQFDVVSYPSNKAFGLWAFTTSNKDVAKEIFEDLESRVVNRLTLKSQ